MRWLLFSFLVLFLNQSHAEGGEAICEYSQEPVQWIICVDDDVQTLDQLKNHVQGRIYDRIEWKYKKDLDRAKMLKEKLDKSISIWDKYRHSYCDMESIYIRDEDERSDFIKQCLLSITKTRIEELRLLQINI